MPRNREEMRAQGVLADAALKAQALLVSAAELQKRELPYSNRELDLKFQTIKELILSTHEERKLQNDKILVQTTETNGTVRWTVKMIYLGVGGLSVLTLIVVPILTWALLQINTNSSSLAVLQSKVHALTPQ